MCKSRPIGINSKLPGLNILLQMSRAIDTFTHALHDLYSTQLGSLPVTVADTDSDTEFEYVLCKLELNLRLVVHWLGISKKTAIMSNKTLSVPALCDSCIAGMVSSRNPSEPFSLRPNSTSKSHSHWPMILRSTLCHFLLIYLAWKWHQLFWRVGWGLIL